MAVLSVCDKYQLKGRLEGISKKLKAWLKENMGARTAAVDATAERNVAKALEESKVLLTSYFHDIDMTDPILLILRSLWSWNWIWVQMERLRKRLVRNW